MDKKSLLENGLLEQYLLGELDVSQREQIENLLESDQLLKTHYDQLESDFETIGHENAVLPPQHVKAELLDRIKSSMSPNMESKSPSNSWGKPFYLAFAASLAILLGFASFWLYSELNTMKQELQIVESKNTELNSTINALNLELTDQRSVYNAITNPDTEQYVLSGNENLPQAKVVSYVNHELKSVVINTERLPELDADEDYQMWADVEGEMINMGVIPKSTNITTMAYIDNAESLNITIEPAGGNDHPTVSRLIGNVYLE